MSTEPLPSKNGVWQPIETAPPDIAIEMGKWSCGPGKLIWMTNVGRAKRTERFAFWKCVEKTFDGSYYSHWRKLPEPPQPTPEPPNE